MKVLGIYDGHNSSAAFIKDGKIIAAVEEERLSRIKFHHGNYDGFNAKGIDSVLHSTNTDICSIDSVAVSLEHPLYVYRYYTRFFRDVLRRGAFGRLLFFTKQYKIAEKYFPKRLAKIFSPLLYLGPIEYQVSRYLRVKKELKKLGLDKKIKWINHHKAHASSAYYTSGKPYCLIFTLDGKGDGLSGSVYIGDGGRLKLIKEIDMADTIGEFYASTTQFLGFKAYRHEGKITGLAAFGKPVCSEMEGFISFKKDSISYDLGKRDFGPYPFMMVTNSIRDNFTKVVAKYKKEDIAATAQYLLEKIVLRLIKHYVHKTGIRDITVSGGVFGNVRLNQKIAELKEVDSIFIHPAMNDGGLSAGAGLSAYSEIAGLDPYELDNVYLGPCYSNEDIENELDNNKLKYSHTKTPGKFAGDMVAGGNVVAFYQGKLEYGPRALGNRSILYTPTDKTVNEWLNKRLKRSDFMPFAPVTLERYAEECYNNYQKSAYPARFMTITFDCTDYTRKSQPAVVHVDGTARPQIINSKTNREYYNALKQFHDKTGLPSFINTSFNMHEEPIVCTPFDAIRAFKLGHLDVLVIGNKVVYKQ